MLILVFLQSCGSTTVAAAAAAAAATTTTTTTAVAVAAQEKGVSSWLAALPLAQHGFSLTRGYGSAASSLSVCSDHRSGA